MNKEMKTTWGTASLVCGIVGVVLWLAPYIGIIFNICAIVFYGLQKKEGPITRATSGLVLGIVGACINLVMLLLVFVVLVAMPGAF